MIRYNSTERLGYPIKMSPVTFAPKGNTYYVIDEKVDNAFHDEMKLK